MSCWRHAAAVEPCRCTLVSIFARHASSATTCKFRTRGRDHCSIDFVPRISSCQVAGVLQGLQFLQEEWMARHVLWYAWVPLCSKHSTRRNVILNIPKVTSVPYAMSLTACAAGGRGVRQMPPKFNTKDEACNLPAASRKVAGRSSSKLEECLLAFSSTGVPSLQSVTHVYFPIIITHHITDHSQCRAGGIEWHAIIVAPKHIHSIQRLTDRL